MSTAFGTYGPTSGPQPSTSTGSDSSSSGGGFNWMEAISQLQNEIKYESFKKKYPIYTIPEETHEQVKKYK